jgi:hypothetical protein
MFRLDGFGRLHSCGVRAVRNLPKPARSSHMAVGSSHTKKKFLTLRNKVSLTFLWKYERIVVRLKSALRRRIVRMGSITLSQIACTRGTSGANHWRVEFVRQITVQIRLTATTQKETLTSLP